MQSLWLVHNPKKHSSQAV
uniref:Uncharacterized protein n=1 Tax=Anguilla anguilla TaxID=7936 RepID=A0A0E9QGI5_ANGAN